MQKYLKIKTSAENLKAELLRFEQWPDWWPGVDRVEVVERAEGRAVLNVTITLRKRITMTLEIDTSRAESIRFVQRQGWFKSYGGCWELLPTRTGSGDTILKITAELTPPAFVPKSRVYQELASSLDLLEERLNQRLRDSGQPEPLSAEKILPGDDAPKAGPKVHVFPTSKGFEVWIRGRCFQLKYAGRSGQGFDLAALGGKDSA